jgi:hypothetical protein
LEEEVHVKIINPNVPEIGTYIYLTDLKLYAWVKSKIEDDMYECVVNDME